MDDPNDPKCEFLKTVGLNHLKRLPDPEKHPKTAHLGLRIWRTMGQESEGPFPIHLRFAGTREIIHGGYSPCKGKAQTWVLLLVRKEGSKEASHEGRKEVRLKDFSGVGVGGERPWHPFASSSSSVGSWPWHPGICRFSFPPSLPSPFAGLGQGKPVYKKTEQAWFLHDSPSLVSLF